MKNLDLQSLMDKANFGDIEAQYDLGRRYYHNEGVEQDYSEAFKWYEKAAEQGHSEAQYYLGWYYYHCYVVEQDYEKAFEWFQKSAEQGDMRAQFYLGLCYYSGQGTGQNYEEAIRWYRKAAESGNAPAQSDLGRCYYEGHGMERNYEESVKWYKKAAEQNHLYGQYHLGMCYYSGHGVEQDYKKAVEYFIKSADQGYSEAERMLGVCYEKGNGVDQNPEKAVELYEKAAEKENHKAYYNLAKCYERAIGVGADYAKAASYYEKVVQKNKSDAQSMNAFFYLGKYYEEGKGVEQDYERAVEYYNKAIEKGYAVEKTGSIRCYEILVNQPSPKPEYEYMYGKCYANGQGVNKNKKVAVEWYKKAAAQGHAAAQYDLGLCYAWGMGAVVQNYKTALELFEQAAEQGHLLAQYNLGVCYTEGKVIKKEEKTAVKWYRKAADQGDAYSQFCLGFCYEEGRGVDKDEKQAVEWYGKASEQGCVYAQQKLGDCYKDGRGIDANQQMAINWHTKAQRNLHSSDSEKGRRLGLPYSLEYGKRRLIIDPGVCIKEIHDKVVNGEITREEGLLEALESIENRFLHESNLRVDFGSSEPLCEDDPEYLNKQNLIWLPDEKVVNFFFEAIEKFNIEKKLNNVNEPRLQWNGDLNKISKLSLEGYSEINLKAINAFKDKIGAKVSSLISIKFQIFEENMDEKAITEFIQFFLTNTQVKGVSISGSNAKAQYHLKPELGKDISNIIRSCVSIESLNLELPILSQDFLNPIIDVVKEEENIKKFDVKMQKSGELNSSILNLANACVKRPDLDVNFHVYDIEEISNNSQINVNTLIKIDRILQQSLNSCNMKFAFSPPTSVFYHCETVKFSSEAERIFEDYLKDSLICGIFEKDKKNFVSPSPSLMVNILPSCPNWEIITKKNFGITKIIEGALISDNFEMLSREIESEKIKLDEIIFCTYFPPAKPSSETSVQSKSQRAKRPMHRKDHSTRRENLLSLAIKYNSVECLLGLMSIITDIDLDSIVLVEKYFDMWHGALQSTMSKSLIEIANESKNKDILDCLEEISKNEGGLSRQTTTDDKGKLVKINIPGDGNCLFRAVAIMCEYLDNAPEYAKDHTSLRDKVIEEFRAGKHVETIKSTLSDEKNKRVEDIGEGEIKEYIIKMSCNGVWGGTPEIIAMSNLLKQRILIHHGDTIIKMPPGKENDNLPEDINLSYEIAGGISQSNHYNLLVNEETAARMQIDQKQPKKEVINVNHDIRQIEVYIKDIMLSDGDRNKYIVVGSNVDGKSTVSIKSKDGTGKQGTEELHGEFKEALRSFSGIDVNCEPREISLDISKEVSSSQILIHLQQYKYRKDLRLEAARFQDEFREENKREKEDFENRLKDLFFQEISARVVQETNALKNKVDENGEKITVASDRSKELDKSVEDMNAKINALEEKTGELYEEYLTKQRLLKEQKALLDDPYLSIFYTSVQGRLSDILLASKTINSGLVTREMTNKEKVVEIAGSIIPIPGSSLVGELATSAGEKISDAAGSFLSGVASKIIEPLKEEGGEIVNGAIWGGVSEFLGMRIDAKIEKAALTQISDIDKISESVARHLCKVYKKQIMMMDRFVDGKIEINEEAITGLAECAVGRMISFIHQGGIEGVDTLDDKINVLVNSINSFKASQGKVPFTSKNIIMLPTLDENIGQKDKAKNKVNKLFLGLKNKFKDNDSDSAKQIGLLVTWTDEGIFQGSGIIRCEDSQECYIRKVENKDYLKRAKKYGFRIAGVKEGYTLQDHTHELHNPLPSLTTISFKERLNNLSSNQASGIAPVPANSFITTVKLDEASEGITRLMNLLGAEGAKEFLTELQILRSSVVDARVEMVAQITEKENEIKRLREQLKEKEHSKSFGIVSSAMRIIESAYR